MGEFIGESEFQNFLKASSYIQEFTRRLLERSTKNVIKIPENLTNVHQLAILVKQFLREQQELAGKVEKVHESQTNFNDFIKERLNTCKCDMQQDVKSLLTKDINLDDIKRDNGTDFSLKLPSTSSTNFAAYLDPIIGAEHQARIDLELIKMFETVGNPFSPQDLYHQIPHSSNSTNSVGVMTSQQQLQQQQQQENGLNGFQDPQQFFNNDSSSTSPPTTEQQQKQRKIGKSAKRRAHVAHHEQPINGPYQCRDCDKTFRQKHGLSQHLLTHESNGAFECDGCGKRYSRQESVYRHQRSTQCSKYHPLTNVRHDDVAGSSTDSKDNSLQLLQQRGAFLL